MHCPQTEFAPRTELEVRAWRTARGPGVWRFYWAPERDDDDKSVSVAKPEGLNMAEALTRCPPVDDADRAALVEAFTTIELGARHGVSRGMNLTDTEREGRDG